VHRHRNTLLLRRNDRFGYFANMLDENPNQGAQHPVLQRQDRDGVPVDSEVDRQDFQRKLGGVDSSELGNAVTNGPLDSKDMRRCPESAIRLIFGIGNPRSRNASATLR
jgi:hypothetical protein